MRHFQRLFWLAPILALQFAGAAAAQQKPAAQPNRIIPLKVDIVLSEYAGTKEISRLPYTLTVNATSGPQLDWVHLRLGDRVPIATETATYPGQNIQFQYQDMGTNIDCGASPLQNGDFRLTLKVERSSGYSVQAGKMGGMSIVGGQPIIRQFQVSDTLVLRDGQSDTSTMATDPTNGHVLRVAVTLHVVKR